MSITNKKLHTRANDIVDADAIVDEVNGLEDGTKVFSTIKATNAVIGSIAKPAYSEATLLNGYTGTFHYRKEASGNINLFVSISAPDPIVSVHIATLPSGYFNTNIPINIKLFDVSNGTVYWGIILSNGEVWFNSAGSPIALHTYTDIEVLAV